MSQTQKPKKERREGIDELLVRLDQQLESLKSLYEHYFAGVSKRPPLREHSDFKRALDTVPAHELKITANRFKLQTIKSRHLQLNNLWIKTLGEIEAGTYKRDRFLLKAKEALRASSSPSKTKAPSQPTLKSAYEFAYEQYVKLAEAQNQKVPSKEKFAQALDSQIAEIKKTNPSAKIAVKVQKDANGRIGLKIKPL